jgi:hypothetical protein
MSSHDTSYWRLVCDCLVAFHQFTEGKALDTIQAFRVKLFALNDQGASELIYHQEPFYLAAQLASGEAREPTKKEAAQYDEMLKRRVNETTALGTDDEVRHSIKRGKAA